MSAVALGQEGWLYRIVLLLHVITAIVGFWCIGMPVSLWLGFGAGYGAVGLWWGLVVGLVMVATFLLVRVRQHEQRDLAKLHDFLGAPHTFH